MSLRSRNARLVWRGGRAVDRAGLENRKAERPREFESHPLRHLSYKALTSAETIRIRLLHKGNTGPPALITTTLAGPLHQSIAILGHLRLYYFLRNNT